MLNTITNIDRDSPARGKVKIGDELLSINGHGVEDVLDYRYWSYEPRLSLVLRSGETGREYTVKIRKDAGEDLGLDFEEYLMDKPWGCSNRCLFCFIDQLPRGLRRTLYFKDDDARLSFLTGSYITLTNLSEREMERICALKISPINVSVHATDPELRAKLMGNPKAADIMGPLRRLTAAGITVDCQIVCCPGYNDKEQLSRSMRITTGMLNNVLADAQARQQPPTDKGRRLKIYYMTQTGVRPPNFVIFCNSRELFHFSYQRYLENQIRAVFGLEGTPIRIVIRQKGDKE